MPTAVRGCYNACIERVNYYISIEKYKHFNKKNLKINENSKLHSIMFIQLKGSLILLTEHKVLRNKY